MAEPAHPGRQRPRLSLRPALARRSRSAGDRWSIDARRRSDGPAVRGWAFPIRILELQIAWIYLATGLEKLGGIDWIVGTAAYYALQLEHTFGRPWAHALAVDPLLSHLISWYTLAVELAFLPLVMIPSRVTRLIAAVAAAAMHVGILVLMNVGNFPLVMIAACVLFIPPEWVHSAHARRSVSDRRATASRTRPRAAAVLLLLLAVTRVRDGGTVTGGRTAASRRCRAGASRPLPRPALGHVLAERRTVRWLDARARHAGGRHDGSTCYPLGRDDRSERYSDPFYTRWTKVHERIASPFYAGYRSEYARHFCRTRNSIWGRVSRRSSASS